jgi:hypothetical protein
MSNLQDQISKLVAGFVDEITSLARQAAVDILTGALHGKVALAPVGAPRRGRPGRPPGSVSSARRPKGAKRPPGEIVETMERLRSYIKENPGQRIEQINKSLGTSTKDLNLPIKKLVKGGEVRTEGEKRATTYFPGDGSPSGGGRKRKKG